MIDIDKLYEERQTARQAVTTLVDKATELDAAIERVERAYNLFVQEEAKYATALSTQIDNKGVVNRVGNDLDAIAVSALLKSAPRFGAILGLNPRLAKRDVARARGSVLKRLPQGYEPENA